MCSPSLFINCIYSYIYKSYDSICVPKLVTVLALPSTLMAQGQLHAPRNRSVTLGDPELGKLTALLIKTLELRTEFKYEKH